MVYNSHQFEQNRGVQENCRDYLNTVLGSPKVFEPEENCDVSVHICLTIHNAHHSSGSVASLSWTFKIPLSRSASSRNAARVKST